MSDSLQQQIVALIARVAALEQRQKDFERQLLGDDADTHSDAATAEHAPSSSRAAD